MRVVGLTGAPARRARRQSRGAVRWCVWEMRAVVSAAVLVATALLPAGFGTDAGSMAAAQTTTPVATRGVEPTAAMADARAGAASEAASAGGLPADGAWPPVEVGPGVSAGVGATVPAFWPEAEKGVAWVWLAVQHETRACMILGGADYRAVAPWAEFDRNGRAVRRPSPPADWGPAFEKPPRASAPCFDRALALAGCPHQRRAREEPPAVTTCHRTGKQLTTRANPPP